MATAAAQVPGQVQEQVPGEAAGEASSQAPAEVPGDAAPPASASSSIEDVYTVRDVEVDVTAASAAAARDEAIAEAQREAYAELVQRLAPPGTEVPPAGDAELARMVQDFEVQRERSSSVRYLATLTVRFRPDAVRNHLQSGNVAFTETMSKPVLVLPVYRAADGEPVLWEDRTAWRDAWENAPPGGGLVPVQVPYGELADLSDISAEEAVSGDTDALAAIAERYGAGDVLVAELPAPAGGPDPSVPGEVRLTRYGADGPEPTRTVPVPARPDGTVEDYLGAAVAAVGSLLEEDWKLATTSASQEEGSILVTVPIGRLDDWVQTRRRLGEVPLVSGAVLRALSRDEATVELRYRGDADRLRTALAQQDLMLEDPPTVDQFASPLPPYGGVPGAPAYGGVPGMPGAVMQEDLAAAGAGNGRWTLRWAGAAVP